MDKPVSSLSLFSTSQSGLQRVYSALVSANSSSKISLENINTALANVGTTSSNVNLSDLNFLSYIQSNFSSLDKDGDGVINSSEMSKTLTSISSTGLTYSQLATLSSQSSGNDSLLNTVLSNFTEIDKNGDGKVTQSEIDAFNYNKEIKDQKAQYQNQSLKQMSLYNADAITSVSENDSDDDDNQTSNKL